MACSSSCLTQDHSSWGECVRDKGLRVGWAASAKGIDASREKKWQKNLDDYQAAKDAGIQPRGTSPAAVREAVELSESTGKAARFDRTDLGIA